MPDILLLILDAAVSAGVGAVIVYFVIKNTTKKTEEDAQQRAAEILKNAEITAENIKKDRILEAKEKFLKLRSEFEEDSTKKKQILVQNEQTLKESVN